MFVEAQFLRFCAIPVFLFFSSCGMEDPKGSYNGYVQDWVYEVFDGTLTSEGQNSQLRIVLKNTPDGLFSEIIFRQPGEKEVIRLGKWDVGDGKRILSFPDGDIREYYLIKRGARFAFQSKQGISNDDGSSVLLMRNEGLSRKESYFFSLNFIDDEEVLVRGGGIANDLKGTWKWASGRVVVVVELPPAEEAKDQGESLESYKYFLRWSDDGTGELELEKMVVLRPFLKEDGSKRQSWMSSLIFPDPPRLEPN